MDKLANLHNLEHAKQAHALINFDTSNNLFFGAAFKIFPEPCFNFIRYCNEPIASYAVDGYVKAKGVGVYSITFIDGVFNKLNTIAEIYSKEFPLVCVMVINSLGQERGLSGPRRSTV
ncbi:hypothetical protein AMTRI_Chr12g239410 [Amborella trichopoda]